MNSTLNIIYLFQKLKKNGRNEVSQPVFHTLPHARGRDHMTKSNLQIKVTWNWTFTIKRKWVEKQVFLSNTKWKLNNQTIDRQPLKLGRIVYSRKCNLLLRTSSFKSMHSCSPSWIPNKLELGSLLLELYFFVSCWFCRPCSAENEKLKIYVVCCIQLGFSVS